MNIYLDMNVYYRLFDDKSQLRIRREVKAVNTVLNCVAAGKYILYGSFVLDYENRLTPLVRIKTQVEALLMVCSEYIKPESVIREMADEIVSNSNAKLYDALHLACAIYGKCSYFITCDDRFIKTINHHMDKLDHIIGSLEIVNPVEFARREMDEDVTE